MKIFGFFTVALLSAALSAQAFAQGQQVNQGQTQATAPTIAAAAPTVSPGGGLGGLGPVITSLRCLEWHCQGSECICIRFTTE